MNSRRVSDFKLFIPGPTPVANEVLQAMATPVMGHRSKDYQALHRDLKKLLKSLFQTKDHALAVTASASMCLDALIRQIVRPGRKVVNLTCGAFSERWHEASLSYGLDIQVLSFPWGSPYKFEELDSMLARGDVDAVTCVHSETSTGVLNSLAELSEVTQKYPDVVVVVDAVSSLGSVSIPFDSLDLDACVAGVQKDLACPPGLTVMALSEKCVRRAQEVPNRGWAFDILKLVEKDQSDFALSTPSLSHLWALKKRLEYMEEEGAERRWARHVTMAEMLESWALKRFDLLAPENYRSQSLTAIRCPSDFDPMNFIERMKQKTGFILGEGYGKLKPTTFRVAHMGECQLSDVDCLIEAMESCL